MSTSSTSEDGSRSVELAPNSDGRGTLKEAKRNYLQQSSSLTQELFGSQSNTRRAGQTANGDARYVPRYRPPGEIMSAYLKARGSRPESEEVVDTQLLLLKDIVEHHGAVGEREGYRAPSPPDGAPGRDRPLVLDDMVVNMHGYENDDEALRLLNETPDYVVVFRDVAGSSRAAADAAGAGARLDGDSIRWDGRGPLDAEVLRRSGAGASPEELYDRHRRMIVGSLRKVGLIVRQEARGGKIYVLVWGPEDVLEQRAEDEGLKVALKAGHDVKRFLSEYGYPVAGGRLHPPSNVANLVTRYEERQLQAAMSLPFRVVDRWMFRRLEPSARLRLIHSLMESDRDVGGAAVPFERLVAQGKAESFFAVHDKHDQASLRRDWVLALTPSQPIDRVRAYFGEKIAVYFSWLGFYTFWLYIPAVLGLTVFIYGISKDTLDNDLTPWYAALLACWITLFMEFWKRYQAALAFRFNMTDFKEEEKAQPRFQGEPTFGFYGPNGAGFLRLDPEAYEELGIPRAAVPSEDYSSGLHRGFRIAFSAAVVMLCVVGSGVLTLSILALRAHLSETVDGIFEPDFDPDATRWGAIAAGIVMGVTIAILNAGFKVLARGLTRWENHRTLSEFESALVLKLFVLQAFTSYASLFYTAYLKNEGILDEWFGVRDECIDGGCLSELSYQLGSIMITQLIMGQLIENIVPFALRHGRVAFMHSGGEELREYEKQAALETSLGTVDEYSEMVLQLGYVAMFAVAFPIGGVLALVNNIIEMRTDANKFLHLTRRPHWEGASDIGPWYFLVQFIGIVSVITNATIVAFVSTQLDTYFSGEVTTANRWAVAIVAEHIILFIKLLIMYFTPDMPAIVAKYMALEDNADKVTLKERLYRKKFSWSSTPLATDAPVSLDTIAAAAAAGRRRRHEGRGPKSGELAANPRGNATASAAAAKRAGKAGTRASDIGGSISYEDSLSAGSSSYDDSYDDSYDETSTTAGSTYDESYY